MSMDKLDIGQAAGFMTRELKNVERDGKPAKVIVAARTFDTNIDDAWDAITNAQRIPRWFMPVEGELRLGGRFAFKGNASGTIATCDRPKHLAVTWENMGQVSWVEVRLTSLAAEETRLVLEHTAHVPEEFWKKYGPGAVGVGWELGLLGLGLFLADPLSDVAKEGTEWGATPVGKEFMRISSEAWARASIAAGTPAAEANAAGDETTKFYTGDG
jgi:uncharacterized protein YndB with AHSA1/START domain